MTYTTNTTSTEIVEAAKEGEVLPPLPPLEQEARECGEMFKEGQRLQRHKARLDRHIERADKKIEDLRIALGLKLVGLRRRVEAGEAGDEAALTWWQWFEAHIPFSRKHAERWMMIAASEAPEAAALEYRERHAAQQQAYRGRKKFPAPAHISREREGEPSRPTASLGDRSPMKLWSTLHAFNDEYLDRDPAKVVAGMSAEMRSDLQQLGPRIAQWLLKATEKLIDHDRRMRTNK
jgi:hypothetical protein